MITFNLKKHMKTANYDGGKGLMTPMTRCFQNCQKFHREKGKGAQEAWFGCLDEWNTNKNGDWNTKYSGHPAGKE